MCSGRRAARRDHGGHLRHPHAHRIFASLIPPGHHHLGDHRETSPRSRRRALHLDRSLRWMILSGNHIIVLAAARYMLLRIERRIG